MENQITLINISNGGVGLRDTSGRAYSVQPNSRLRISQESFKNILDYPASKAIIFGKKYLKIEGAKVEMFLDSGLTDEQLAFLTGKEEKAPVKKVEEVAEDDAEDVVEDEEEDVEARVTEIAPAEEGAPDVKALVYYNWIRNGAFDKVKESLTNPKNVKTLKDIVKKHEKYDVEEVRELLAEVE